MPSIVKRVVKGVPYYYLVHTVRKKGRFTQKSLYLGRAIPKDIDRVRRRFTLEIDQERWFAAFVRIKENYDEELRNSPKSAALKELKSFSVRFTYDTQRIEGSTLSLRETSRLLEEGISPNNRPISDIKEAESHQKLLFEILAQENDLTLQEVLDWHWRLFKDTKPDIAGQIRKHGVKISGSRFVPASPVELQALLTDFFRWYNRSKGKTNPVEMAALAHLKFVTIHPLSDGNGRISRLIMNFILHRHGYPMLNIDYKRRSSYYRALERAQLAKDERIFLVWFFRWYERQFKSHE
jgi:Fic family protein